MFENLFACVFHSFANFFCFYDEPFELFWLIFINISAHFDNPVLSCLLRFAAELYKTLGLHASQGDALLKAGDDHKAV